MSEKLQVRLEEKSEAAEKPSFWARHKRGIIAGLGAAGGAIVTMVILAVLGKDGKDTIDCAREAWELKQFQDSVDGTFDGSEL